jgi:hypothetical protein
MDHPRRSWRVLVKRQPESWWEFAAQSTASLIVVFLMVMIWRATAGEVRWYGAAAAVMMVWLVQAVRLASRRRNRP